MIYMRFKPVRKKQWDVIAPVKSDAPIANVRFLTRKGVIVRFAPDREFSREELSSIDAFLSEKDARVKHSR